MAIQGIKRGSNSLINRINTALVQKNAKSWGLKDLPSSPEQVNSLLVSKGMGEDWQRYLTVLNLRNYGCTKNYVLTEMIYVHSKLTIVDDAVAIIGSANINDRSLMGNGDTELAAVVVDGDNAKVTDVGAGIKVVTRDFARKLRIAIWKKHLGMEVDELTSGVQKNTSTVGIDLHHPLAQETINAIKKIARTNRLAYNEVFLHTPRDDFKSMTTGRKRGYPYSNALLDKHDFSRPPLLQPDYMFGVMHNSKRAIALLRAKVTGFWVEMPLGWGFAQGKTPAPPTHFSSQAIAEIDRASNEYKQGA